MSTFFKPGASISIHIGAVTHFQCDFHKGVRGKFLTKRDRIDLGISILAFPIALNKSTRSGKERTKLMGGCGYLEVLEMTLVCEPSSPRNPTVFQYPMVDAIAFQSILIELRSRTAIGSREIEKGARG